VRDGSDDRGGDQRQTHREQRDRAGVVPEVTGGGALRRGEQQRWQHDGKDEIGLDLDRPNPREEGNQQTEEGEQNR